MKSNLSAAGPSAVLWHYTVRAHLHRILADGQLRPVAIAGLKHVKPVVWFTAHTDWEPMANRLWQDPNGKWVRLGKDPTIVLFGGLARIAVAKDVAPLDWKAYKDQSGAPPKLVKAIYDEAVSLGSRPGQWFATFQTVPREQWLAVEVWENEAWVRQG